MKNMTRTAFVKAFKERFGAYADRYVITVLRGKSAIKFTEAGDSKVWVKIYWSARCHAYWVNTSEFGVASTLISTIFELIHEVEAK